jgi:hypothetical protein
MSRTEDARCGHPVKKPSAHWKQPITSNRQLLATHQPKLTPTAEPSSKVIRMNAVDSGQPVPTSANLDVVVVVVMVVVMVVPPSPLSQVKPAPLF